MPDKKPRQHVISFRIDDDALAELMLKVTDSRGQQIISPSAFARAALESSQVHVVDQELEAFRVYVAAKLGNNINQIARRLNTDAKGGVIDTTTYSDVAAQLASISDELQALLQPVYNNEKPTEKGE
jgi:hypothetical protein